MRKELREIFRDRRTILTLVLMPLLLYPLLGVAFQTFRESNLTPTGAPVYRIGTAEADDRPSVETYLRMGHDAIQQRETPEEQSARRAASSPPPHQRPDPELRFVAVEDLENAVIYGLIDAGVRLRPSGRFMERLQQDRAVDWELLYREDSALGLDAVRHLEELCSAANTRLARPPVVSAHRAAPRDAGASATDSPGQSSARKSTLLPGLVPLILILMTITGAVYPAIDLTAGERERGTLEILAAAPVPRLSVLFAKYVAVVTVAMLTALVNLGTMSVTLYVTGMGEALFGEDSLSPLVLVQVLALLLLFAAFFSAVLLALTSFARSFKEAQAYLVPLMLLALMPGILSLVPGLQLQGPLVVAPLINIVLLTRDLLEGVASPMVVVVVVASTLLYALAALAVAAQRLRRRGRAVQSVGRLDGPVSPLPLVRRRGQAIDIGACNISVDFRPRALAIG